MESLARGHYMIFLLNPKVPATMELERGDFCAGKCCRSSIQKQFWEKYIG